MNRPTSSLTDQDFVRLPADRSMADAMVRPSVSYWKDVLRRIRSDKVAMVSLTFLVLIILMAIFAPLFSPYGYETTDLLNTNQAPSAAHWFGTDAGGRDLWTRVWVRADLPDHRSGRRHCAPGHRYLSGRPVRLLRRLGGYADHAHH